MNICIVSDLYDTPYGGPSRVIKLTSEKLIERGYKITIITSKYKNKKSFERKENFTIYRFRSVVLPRSQGEYTFAFPNSKKINEIFKKEKVEIIHCHIPSLLALFCISEAKRMNIPTIATHHILSETFLSNMFFNIKKSKILFYNTLASFYNSFEIVTGPSHYAIKILKNHGLKIKSMILSNGVDTSKFNPNLDCKSFLKKFKLSKKTKKILFVGRLMKEKGLDILLKACPIVQSKIPDIKIIIVGMGYLKKDLEELAQKLNLKNVIFTGFIPEKLLKEAYVASDIFVLPSYVETQGLVLLEAAASGLPLLGTNTTAIPELVIDGWNGYTFELRNHEDLAKQIIRILSNEKLMKKFSKNTLELAKKHDIERTIDELEKIYRKLTKIIE